MRLHDECNLIQRNGSFNIASCLQYFVGLSFIGRATFLHVAVMNVLQGGGYAFNSSEAMIVLTGISKSINETSISENQLWLRA